MDGNLDAALAMIAQQLGLSAERADQLHRDVVALVDAIAEDGRLSPVERRRHRKERLAAIKAMMTALQRPRKVVEQLPPRVLTEISQLLAREIGTSFSNSAFLRADAAIGYDMSPRHIEFAISRYRRPDEALAHEFEGQAAFERRRLATRRGVDVALGVLDRLSAALQRELTREVLEAPDGRPHQRPRQLALAGLWDIYSSLTDSALPRTPPRAYLDLCATLVPVMGINPVGLDEAAERLFARAAARIHRAEA